jgi:hypothetical protein
MGSVVSLVPMAISEDTARAIAYLQQEVAAGRIVGLAWTAIHPGHEYSVDVAGEAKTLPAFTRGTVGALDDQLAKLKGPCAPQRR